MRMTNKITGRMMKSKIMGLLAVGLLAGPMAAMAGAVPTPILTADGTINGVDADTSPGLLVNLGETWQNVWTITNSGADMGGTSIYDLFFDSTQLASGSFQLSAGQSLMISYPAVVQSGTHNFRIVLATGSIDYNWYTTDASSVPEPGTLALLGLGLAGLGLSRRRKAN